MINYKKEELRTLKKALKNLYKLDLDESEIINLSFNFNKRIKELE